MDVNGITSVSFDLLFFVFEIRGSVGGTAFFFLGNGDGLLGLDAFVLKGSEEDLVRLNFSSFREEAFVEWKCCSFLDLLKELVRVWTSFDESGLRSNDGDDDFSRL